jgi:hypothetical protein
MKVVLDIDKLRSQGRITPDEHDQLRRFATEETGSLGINILIAFGVVAIAAGTLAQLHSSEAAIALGLVLGSTGVLLVRRFARLWGVLGSILTLVGATTAAGGFIMLSQGTREGYLYAVLLCAAGAVAAKSGLLSAMSALAVAGALGAGAEPGSSFAPLQKPAATVGLFVLLSWGTYRWSLRLGDAHQRLALMFARTSLFLANLGFWMGSMIGDNLWSPHADWSLLGPRRDVDAPAWVFAVVWAIALIATGLWALRRNRRWAVNLLAVFAAIHLFTQYFKRLSATPMSLIVAGVLALAIALAIARYNREFESHPPGRASRAA